MTEVCLTLLGAPEVEEKLLDQLLMTTTSAVFTSQPAASHGGHIVNLDPREQVLGRGDAVLIQVLLEAQAAQTLLLGLREQLRGAGVRYWLTPVIEQGAL